jgi:hypothetical protein
MYNNSTGLPSVTDILSPYINTDWFTEECCIRGSAAHAAAAAHLQGLYAPPLQPDWQLYVESFKKWADLAIDKVIVVEQRFVNKKLGYCGQPDLVAVLKGEKYPVLIDWKTGQAHQKFWALQITAYRTLLEHNGIETYKGLSVRLKKDGSGCLATQHGNNTSGHEWNVFVGLLNSYTYFNNGRSAEKSLT